MTSFNFVIVNYHSEIDTELCIDILKKIGSEYKIHITVVCNSNHYVSKQIDNVTYYNPKKNIGLAAAWDYGFKVGLNLGFSHTIFLNNDAIIDPSFMSILNDVDDDILSNSAIGPVIYDSERRIWSSGGRFERPLLRVIHFDDELPDKIVKTEHISGCCLIVPNKILRDIKGVDTDFFFRGEEWDLNYRLLCHQVPQYIIKDLKVYHKVNGSHDQYSPKMIYYLVRAKILFARKHLIFTFLILYMFIYLGFILIIAPFKYSKLSNNRYKFYQYYSSIVQGILKGVISKQITEKL